MELPSGKNVSQPSLNALQPTEGCQLPHTEKLLTREHGKRTADSEILQSESKRERTAMQNLENNNAKQENGRPSGETKGSTLHCDFTVSNLIQWDTSQDPRTVETQLEAGFRGLGCGK